MAFSGRGRDARVARRFGAAALVALVIVGLSAGVGVASAAAPPTTYKLLDLGVLPTTDTGPWFLSPNSDLLLDASNGKLWNFSSGTPQATQYAVPAGFVAYAINNSGTVVGTESGPGGTLAGTWTRGTFTPMASSTETVPVGNGSTSWTLTMTAANTTLLDIDNAGDTVGWSGPQCSCAVDTVAVETSGTGGPRVLGRIPSSDENINCEGDDFYAEVAYAFDTGGTVFGGVCWAPIGGAVILNGTNTPVQMPDPPLLTPQAGLPQSYPDAQQVNALGHMVYTERGNPPGGFFWNGSKTISAPAFLPAINDSDFAPDGTKAGEDGAVDAVLWSPAAPTGTDVPIDVPDALSSEDITIGDIDDANDLVGTAYPANAPGEGPLHLVLAVPGCGSGPAQDIGAADAEAHAATAGSCDLKVTVKPLQHSRSGLSRDPVSDASFIDDSSEKCQSGCTDLQVTVKDPVTRKPVKNATVSASVTQITGGIPAYPSGHPSPGFLCNAAHPTRCGSGNFISGLKTNKKGQLKLLYWAPGLIDDESTILTVKASESCNTSACSAGHKSGEADKTLSVSRNLIYRHEMPLSLEQAKDLAEWTESGGLKHLARTVGFKKLVTTSVEHLIEEEKAAEHAAEGVEGVLEIAEFGTELWEQQGFMALFMDGLKLSGTGLGDAPDDRTVSAIPGQEFQKPFAAKGNVLGLGTTGILWKLGLTYARLQDEHELKDQTINLYVYEVSYCEQGSECGPGYHDRKGIRPYLYLELTSEHSNIEHSFADAIVVPYNARAWMETQFGR
jgi:hypothetical protein